MLSRNIIKSRSLLAQALIDTVKVPIAKYHEKVRTLSFIFSLQKINFLIVGYRSL